MISKLEPKNSLLALLIVYFGLGYAVGRTSDDAPNQPPEAEPAPVVEAPLASPTPTGPPVVPAHAPMPRAAVVGLAPVPSPPVVAVAEPAPAARPAAQSPPPQPTAAAPKPEQVWAVPVGDKDAALGEREAAASIVMFSAFGCAACKAFRDSPKRIFAEYGNKVRIVFKHKLIPAPHPDSMDASIAALAAGRQGRFWEYHDRLFAGEELDSATLEAHARALKLDLGKFKRDRRDPALRGQVLADSLLAWQVGAHSMPNILINGVRMTGEKTHENLVKLLDEQLPPALERMAAGAPRDKHYEELIAGGKTFPQIGAETFAFTTEGSPTLGPAGARIQVVVFEDFECPFCSRVGPSLRSFQARFPQDVRIVFKHLPLTAIHANAQLAAEAAAFAHEHGKFWEMHDILFANQKTLNRANVIGYGKQVGLDVAGLSAALSGGAQKPAVQRDLQEAARAGAEGTPTVFLNGRRYQGPRGTPPEGLEAVARVYLGL